MTILSQNERQKNSSCIDRCHIPERGLNTSVVSARVECPGFNSWWVTAVLCSVPSLVVGRQQNADL